MEKSRAILSLEQQFGAELKDLDEKNLLWNPKSLESASEPWSMVDGKKVLMFCSNNYLGLTNHPEVKEAAIEAVRKYGAGSGSVRPIAGNMALHLKLEETIARFKRTEDAIYYNTGFTANSGAIPAIAGEGDLIISDELNHGSIIDGVRLTKAERAIFKHKNMDDLKRVLEETRSKTYRRIWIITDGVFSMDGDIAPLDKIYGLADQFGAHIYVDDAHGDGVLGSHGRGIVSHFNLDGKVDMEMGTFSKGFGTMGGLIATTKTIKKYLLNKSRTYLLTGSQPPAVIAASIKALEVLERDDSLVKKLWSNTKYFKGKAKELGFDTGESETPITPIMTYDESKARDLSLKLFEEGVYALPIVFPMVAKGKARIRTMIRADFSKEDLDFALEKFGKVGKELGIVK
ncbi:MAG: glycine C-acetyltransferase [Candidatus ainarchaeum sp.]|nr:glycine C-acetyltransferase [Candidatus ainarchaeum sp.]